MRPSRPSVGAALAAFAATAVLSGCGVADDGPHAGTALVVGDQTFSTSEVEDLVDPFCSTVRELNANQAQAQQPGTEEQPIARGSDVRDVVVRSLALRAFADQLAEENGLDPDRIAAQTAQRLRAQLGGVSGDEVDEALPVLAADAYAQAVMTEVAPPPADLPQDQAQQYYLDLLTQWFDDHEVELNPLYSPLDYGAGPVAGSGDVAVGVSDEALAADAVQPDPAALAALPAAQRCG